MITFPCVDREKSGDLVLEAALGVMKALFDHLAERLGGDDHDSRHWFAYTVGRTIAELSDQPRRGEPHMECNIISSRVVEFVKQRAHMERAEEIAAAERERRARTVVQFSAARQKAINAAFQRSSTGDRGPGPRAA